MAVISNAINVGLLFMAVTQRQLKWIRFRNPRPKESLNVPHWPGNCICVYRTQLLFSWQQQQIDTNRTCSSVFDLELRIRLQRNYTNTKNIKNKHIHERQWSADNSAMMLL